MVIKKAIAKWQMRVYKIPVIKDKGVQDDCNVKYGALALIF